MSAVERPARWLAGFAAVSAGPGEAVDAGVRLGPRALAHWDRGDGWVVEPGPFRLDVGRSVADLRLSTDVRVDSWRPSPGQKS